MKKISVVIPVYYNSASLPPLFIRLQELEKSLLSRGLTLELIFVDDGSGDSSWQELIKIKQARPETQIIKLSRNFGARKAIKCGWQFTTGDCCTGLSADLQDPPELILQMVDYWLAGHKFIICTRASRADPFFSKFVAYIYYLCLSLLVDKSFPKGGFDLMLMDKSISVFIKESSKNINFIVLAHWLGFKPIIIPYHRQARKHGKSRWTLGKKITLFLDTILGFSVRPIRIISAIGFVVALGSFILGCGVIYGALIGNVPVQGYASIVVLITFLLGLIIIMLGVIGEYLWRVFDETNKRPEVVIDEVYGNDQKFD